MAVPALSLVKKLAAVVPPVSTFTLTLTLDVAGTCSGLKFDTDCTINWGGSNGSTTLTKNTVGTHACGTTVIITGPNTTTSVQLNLSTSSTMTGISGTFPTSCITLDLSGCTKLTTFPALPSTCTTLNLTGCTGITKIRADPAKIKTLNCIGTGILPPSVLAVPNAWKFPPIIPMKLSDIADQTSTNNWKLNRSFNIPITRYLIIPAGVTLDINGRYVNQLGVLANLGTINNFGGGTIQIFLSGTLNNNNGGTINNNNGAKIIIFGTLNNYSGGTINNNSGGTVNNISSGLINNDHGGSFINNGGTFNNNGAYYGPSI